MPTSRITIHAEPAAARKPELHAPCNGCGVCCLLEPCPLGMLLSGRRTGACLALYWQPQSSLYRCGAIMSPASVVRQAVPDALRWLVVPLSWLVQRWAHRLIAAGQGCDCDVTVK